IVSPDTRCGREGKMVCGLFSFGVGSYLLTPECSESFHRWSPHAIFLIDVFIHKDFQSGPQITLDIR
ncbi:MAG TPA: hypothetical protein DEP53_06115, partial [Bacteroidetes bacterium]|nr:hypothetical protein [Bacteroidota bacterium]